jgi:hypothetical protein
VALRGSRDVRAAVGGRSVLLLAVGGAGALVVASFALHLPKALTVAIAFLVPGFALLLRVGRQRALGLFIIGAAFFSAADVKVGQLDISDVFLVLAVAILFLHPQTEGPLAPLPRAVLAGLALLLLGGVIGSLFEPATSPFPHAFVKPPSKLFFIPPRYGEVLRFAYGTVGVVLLVRACGLTRAQVRRAMVAFGLGAIVSVGWALVQPVNPGDRPRGFTGSPVEFGWISAFAAVVGVGLVLSGRRAARRVGVLVVGAGILGIVISGTRSAVPLLLVSLVILQFGLRSARRTATFALLAVLALALALVGVAGDTPVVTRLAGNTSAQISNNARALVAEDGRVLVREHGVTGVGLQYLFQPHNLILGVLGAAGVIGLAGLAVVGLSLLRRLTITPSDDTITLAILSGTLGIYTCSWVVNVAWAHWLWVPIALVLGVRSPTEATHPRAAHARPEVSGIRAPLP